MACKLEMIVPLTTRPSTPATPRPRYKPSEPTDLVAVWPARVARMGAVRRMGRMAARSIVVGLGLGLRWLVLVVLQMYCRCRSVMSGVWM